VEVGRDDDRPAVAEEVAARGADADLRVAGIEQDVAVLGLSSHASTSRGAARASDELQARFSPMAPVRMPKRSSRFQKTPCAKTCCASMSCVWARAARVSAGRVRTGCRPCCARTALTVRTKSRSTGVGATESVRATCGRVASRTTTSASAAATPTAARATMEPAPCRMVCSFSFVG
jgi:hypothetical protein